MSVVYINRLIKNFLIILIITRMQNILYEHGKSGLHSAQKNFSIANPRF